MARLIPAFIKTYFVKHLGAKIVFNLGVDFHDSKTTAIFKKKHPHPSYRKMYL